MSEAEVKLIEEAKNCTLYTIQFTTEDSSEFERFFRPEGKMSDNVCALPVTSSKLRLYCLRLSDRILILGNGGVKKTRTYNEDDELKGYVLTLQKFDKLIKEGVEDGTITITENILETDKTFDL